MTSIIGIDLAKNTFSVCALNSRGKVLYNKKFSRKKLAIFIKTTEVSFIAMEACGGAHHWARMAETAGHKVKMIHPKYVKPFVKTNKSDETDAHAICEAALRESIVSVPIKQIWAQDVLVLHRVKTRLTKNRVALSNEIRGFLLEYGVSIPIGTSQFKKKVAIILGENPDNLTQLFLGELRDLIVEFDEIQEKLLIVKTKILEFAKSHEICKKLQKIPGVGPMISTAIVAAAGSGSNFSNGRHFAAWLGLVPKHTGTGGKTKTTSISKRGDKYIRSILIQGAHTVVNWAKKNDTPQRKWVNEKLRSKHRNNVAVAIANKNARIIWKILVTGEDYNQSIAYCA